VILSALYLHYTEYGNCSSVSYRNSQAGRDFEEGKEMQINIQPQNHLGNFKKNVTTTASESQRLSSLPEEAADQDISGSAHYLSDYYLSRAFSSSPKEVNIIYTGDIHGAISPMPDKEKGEVGGAAYLAGAIKHEKEKALEVMTLVLDPDPTAEEMFELTENPVYRVVTEKQSIVLDAGDWGQGTLESNNTQGKTMMEVMNTIKYDALEIGNHEFDWGRQALEESLAMARVPVLCSNIFKEDGKLLDGVKPYIIKTIDGLRIGVIGIMTANTPKEGNPKKVEGLTFLDHVDTAKKYIEELRKEKGVDLVIVLSHQSDDEDVKLAQRVEGVVIVSGHSHNVKETSVNGNIIVKSGTQGRQVGHLRLAVDRNDNKIIEYKNEFVSIKATGEIKPDSQIEKMIIPVVELAKKKKAEIIGTSEFDLSHDRLKVEESVLADFITDGLKTSNKCDIAFISSSGIRDQVSKGGITYGDIYRVLPRDDDQSICIDMTGKQIKATMENSARQPKNYLQASGLSAVIDRSKPDGAMVSDIKVNGSPLEPDKVYRVGINEILITGPCGYDEFARGTNVDYGRPQRDILLDYIRQNSPLKAPPKTGRLNYVA